MTLQNWLDLWGKLGVTILEPPPGIDWEATLDKDLTETQARAVVAMCKYQCGDTLHDPKATPEEAVMAFRGFCTLQAPTVRREPKVLAMDGPTQKALEVLTGTLQGNNWSTTEEILVGNSLFLAFLSATNNTKLPGDTLLKILTGLQGLYYSPKAKIHLERVQRLLHSIVAAERSEGRGL